MTKICSVCNISKDVNNFHKNKEEYNARCKTCMSNYYFTNKNKLREKVECECGRFVVKSYLRSHKSKNIHLRNY